MTKEQQLSRAFFCAKVQCASRIVKAVCRVVDIDLLNRDVLPVERCVEITQLRCTCIAANDGYLWSFQVDSQRIKTSRVKYTSHRERKGASFVISRSPLADQTLDASAPASREASNNRSWKTLYANSTTDSN